LDLGLRSGGGIGDVAPRISYKYDEKKKFFSKLLLDILFSILVNMILGNIFFGVIIDTFNELRDLRDIKINDQKNKCFMCHRDRYDNIHNEDFDTHREERHGVFNYVFFIIYLFKKNLQTYSRVEEYVWTQINMGRIDWFPYNSEEEQKEETEKK